MYPVDVSLAPTPHDPIPQTRVFPAPPTVTNPYRVSNEHVAANPRVFSHLPTLYNARGDYSLMGAPSTVIHPERRGTQNSATPLGQI
jgi:hypothetical protein